MKLLDTTDDARRAQIGALRAMSPAERVRVAVDLSEDLRRIVESGVRARHPEWTREQVSRAVLVRVYGERFVDRVWGVSTAGA